METTRKKNSRAWKWRSFNECSPSECLKTQLKKPLYLWWIQHRICAVIYPSPAEFNSSLKGFDLTFSDFCIPSLREMKQSVQKNKERTESAEHPVEGRRGLWPGWSNIVYQLGEGLQGCLINFMVKNKFWSSTDLWSWQAGPPRMFD